MSRNCDELEKEHREHEEKSFSLFKEAEKLYGKALKIPFAQRAGEMCDAVAKHKEAIEEIHFTADIQHQIDEGHCEEAEIQLPEFTIEDLVKVPTHGYANFEGENRVFTMFQTVSPKMAQLQKDNMFIYKDDIYQIKMRMSPDINRPKSIQFNCLKTVAS